VADVSVPTLSPGARNCRASPLCHRFTWSNERERPMLERLDHMFACLSWADLFPHHNLRALASTASDHAPLLLATNISSPIFRRFKFESIWLKPLLQKRFVVSAVKSFFVSVSPTDTILRIQKIDYFSYRLFPAHTQNRFSKKKKNRSPDLGTLAPDRALLADARRGRCCCRISSGLR
jgi:hypothetical protein